ncbi:hypothetical protein F0562_025904 [Nyssa sinensis]|uniref:Uncharacterized protein n=1 Tax=Nyssa sinensis TaxID=561372 RepID=A0A5J5BBD6_9ASTE|nr:hypothetical protein F0562_025904 [Nyssa sinensis]
MAEIELKPENGETKRPNPLFSFLSNLPLFNLLPLNREKENSEVVVSEKTTKIVDEEPEAEETKQVIVKFPDTPPAVPPLKLEAEESEQETNPVVLWQVYAIGGFFVLRWLWARWNERRAKKRSSDDEPRPRPGDD